VYPHRIRLRGPWECEPVESFSGGPVPAAGRVKMPCRWAEAGWADFTGRVRCVRRFGYPGRLDEHERVWLTFAGADHAAEMTLNGHHLGRHEGGGPFEFEITSLLKPRNELVVLVESPDPGGGLWGEVAMEIRCPAYLRGLRARSAAGEIHVEGEVVGTSERPLDLYVLCRNATVAYTTVEAGESFQLVSEPVSDVVAGEAVRVELVDGATVWYAAEVSCEGGGGSFSLSPGGRGPG
jgi:hypothetical protein